MAASLALSLSHIAPLHSPLFRPRRRLLATQPLLRRAVDSGALRVHDFLSINSPSLAPPPSASLSVPPSLRVSAAAAAAAAAAAIAGVSSASRARRETSSLFLAAPSSSASEIFSGSNARAASKTFPTEQTSGLAARGMAAAAAAAAGGAAGPVVADERAGDAVVVYITVPNKETGQKLAASLVGAKLAACVNRVPGVESTYWWEGKIETDNEELLIVKTQRALLPSIQEHLKGNHPYDVPELIALPIVGGSEAYLKWLHDNAPVPPTQPPA